VTWLGLDRPKIYEFHYKTYMDPYSIFLIYQSSKNNIYIYILNSYSYSVNQKPIEKYIVSMAGYQLDGFFHPPLAKGHPPRPRASMAKAVRKTWWTPSKASPPSSAFRRSDREKGGAVTMEFLWTMTIVGITIYI
jgi:hypothetical protein